MVDWIYGCQHYAVRVLYGIDKSGTKGVYLQILKDFSKEMLKKEQSDAEGHKILNEMVLHSFPVSDEAVNELLDTLLQIKSIRVKAKMQVVNMTQDEHNRFVHPCGKTGKELDEHPGSCKDCDKFKSCMKSHSIIDVDDGVDKSRM